MSKIMRVKFSKTDDMIYISHLDIQRLFQRVFRRSKIELTYSTGFNPHPRISYGNALALGVESLGELVDIEIEDEDMSPEDFLNTINNYLPDGLKFVSCIELEGGEKALSSSIEYGVYEFTMENTVGIDLDSAIEKIDSLMSRDEILIKKLNKKKKEVEVDIRPLIHSLEVLKADDEISLKAVLATGSIKNLNTNIFLKEIIGIFELEIDPLDIDIKRFELLKRDGSEILPIM